MSQPIGRWELRKAARAAAETAAAAIERRGPVTPPADELERVAALLAAHRWIFAKTMADNPHWYTLRREWDGRPLVEAPNEDFVDVVRFIRRYGYVERWPELVKGWPYICIDITGFHYWTMGERCEPGPYGRGDCILINRKPLP